MAKAKTTTLNITEAARKAALKTRVGGKITGETIRTRAQELGASATAPSAWGGVIQGLVRTGLLTKTTEMARMTSPQARGRMSPVYIRNSVTA